MAGSREENYLEPTVEQRLTFPADRVGTERTLVYRIALLVCVPILRVLFRPTTSGLGDVPAEGGFILCANQESNLDGFALAYALRPRQVYWMGKAELFNRVTRGFLGQMGVFPVQRGTGDTAAIATAIELAAGGHVVGIFPEGTRRKKGLRKRLAARPHSGAARVAIGAGVPLVPAAIRGTERLTALRRWRIALGAPIAPAEPPEPARPRALTDRLWSEILQLEAELWDRKH